MSDDITFASHSDKPIDPSQVRRLYEGVTWGHGRDDGGILAAIEIGPAVGAWDRDRLIGFTRALSDGKYRAYIEDVMIDPEYRGKRIGERMVAVLVEDLKDIEIVSLFCEPGRVAFYGRNGFERSETQVMMHRKGESDVP